MKRGILGEEDGWAGSEDMADTPRFKDWRSMDDWAAICDEGTASIVVPRALGGERERLLCRGRLVLDWWVGRPRSSPVLVMLLLLLGLDIGVKAECTLRELRWLSLGVSGKVVLRGFGGSEREEERGVSKVAELGT